MKKISLMKVLLVLIIIIVLLFVFVIPNGEDLISAKSDYYLGYLLAFLLTFSLIKDFLSKK